MPEPYSICAQPFDSLTTVTRSPGLSVPSMRELVLADCRTFSTPSQLTSACRAAGAVGVASGSGVAVGAPDGAAVAVTTLVSRLEDT